MKRTGSIGSRVPPAVTSTRRPSQLPPAAGSIASISASRRSGSGRRPAPCSPREASAPVSGSITRIAALAQRRQVRLGRGVGVHAVVHRRSDGARRGAGEEGGGEHRVADPRGELRDRVGRRRRDEVGVGVARRRRGGRSGRGPAARRRGRRRAPGRARTRRRARAPRRCPRTRRRRRSGRRSASSRRGRRARPWSRGGRARAPCRRRCRRSRRAGCGPWVDRTPGAAPVWGVALRAPATARRGSGT